jgi:hypothetical protein
MGRDQDRDAGQFEWVNAWAESAAKPEPAAMAAPVGEPAVTVPPVEAVVAPAPAKPIMTARIAPALPEDQLMRDIAEIERARDALAAMPVAASLSKRRTQALTLVPSRTTDPVPVVVGGVLALVMLTVFGAAAAMTRLAR